ncbi:glycosyltransferase family 4 protein [Marinimicrobium sp. ABcell2]|uniref:glycosyltransferase family 4 protein n=1 Tax=Marinimicrobium sp. ABcell2 TaxID=3069751 RepID=UPI0027B6BF7E|nr:glycosyltransferase family 4 protein [Marinimicrobium sp. ABcell2]MDQ2076175.1 glycosyltransferase family 4 protein [Marinimicrobium sp. ABcell2]
MPSKSGVLAVGNFDSNIGYAWRLMESLWCDLAKVMSERGHEMHVCFPSISVVPACLIEHDYQAHTLDFTDKSLTGVLNQLKFLRQNSIKVVYFTDARTAAFRYALFRFAGVEKIIIHDHTPGVRTRPGRLKSWYKGLLNRLPLISCSACFAVSPYVADRLHTVNCVPKRKIHCVTNGIAVGTPPPERGEKDKLTVVTVGRANYYKGIDFAIKVVEHLVKNLGVTNLNYVLFGDGPDLDEFKEFAETCGVTRHVTFAGAVSDVPERLVQCDIAFHPSRGEAMSLAILEYMRAGLPVVASDNPSVSSALAHNEYALLYREGEVTEAAEALKTLLESPETRLRLGSAARKKVESQFSDESMSRRFVVAVEATVPLTQSAKTDFK